MSHLGCLGTVLKSNPEFSNVNNEIYFLSILPSSLTPLSETFCIKTTLASTKLTQNEGLSSLLKWRAEPRSIQRSLQMFERKINSDELVKFIPESNNL